jgi:L-histidine N-alpha-methyltransferase
MVAAVGEGDDDPEVLELGAGSASKTTLILLEALRRWGRCTYRPLDVSPTALAFAVASLRGDAPGGAGAALCGRHEEALGAVSRESPGRSRLALFIGSSIGNFDDRDAAQLLAGLGGVLGPRGALLLGTDLRKDPSRLIPAYDDAQGVTAAFNLNVLTRLNRELGADFDLARFRHVARWNDRASRMEMHLASVGAQEVTVRALGLTVGFADGETIHTESSVKYDLPRVDALFAAAGLARARTFTDPEELFAVHLARSSAAGLAPIIPSPQV